MISQCSVQEKETIQAFKSERVYCREGGDLKGCVRRAARGVDWASRNDSQNTAASSATQSTVGQQVAIPVNRRFKNLPCYDPGVWHLGPGNTTLLSHSLTGS